MKCTENILKNILDSVKCLNDKLQCATNVAKEIAEKRSFISPFGGNPVTFGRKMSDFENSEKWHEVTSVRFIG